jgi:hypothetical protein
VHRLTRACSRKDPTVLRSPLGNFCSLVSFWGYRCAPPSGPARGYGGNMHGLIYLVGLIVVVLFILSFLGLR